MKRKCSCVRSNGPSIECENDRTLDDMVGTREELLNVGIYEHQLDFPHTRSSQIATCADIH